ncbi:MAG TPA: efflux RND transporter periplasmic adaptor subunit [Gemmatales bacterium]|nr:efflux RND transporter periplasmic adaptor subunit [Gemmatales bacterium]
MLSAKLLSGWMLLLILPILLAGCSDRQPSVAEVPPVEVVVSQPIQEKIEGWDVYTGTVEARESVDVRSRVRGEIKEVFFKEGTEIAAGTELFLIDSGPFQADLNQAKGQLVTWEAKLKLAEERIALYKPLAEKGTVSKEELLKAYSDKGEAVGGIDASRGKILEAELNIGYCKITSPIAGKVGEAISTKGNIVSGSGSDSLLATVISVDPMYVYFNVNERALLNYRKLLNERAAKDPNTAKGEKPKVPVQLALTGDISFPFKGIIDFVDNRVDPATGSIKVRARFENPKGPDGNRSLTSGLFARVRVAIAEPYQGILVADRAILTDQSLKYVLIVNKQKKNLVERVDITVSNRVQESGLREVQSGLKGDEWIIVEGVNRARPGVTVNPKEAAMPRRPVK